MKKNNSLRDKAILILATLSGVGYFPMMPGTASCVVALLVFLLVKSQFYFLIITLVSLVVAFLVSGKAEKLYGVKDCKKIVIDDFSGMLVTFLFIPRRLEFIICGFFLFRMLDMIKIPPANKIEELHGSLGIVGDDLIAGIYALGIIQAVNLLLSIIS